MNAAIPGGRATRASTQQPRRAQAAGTLRLACYQSGSLAVPHGVDCAIFRTVSYTGVCTCFAQYSGSNCGQCDTTRGWFGTAPSCKCALAFSIRFVRDSCLVAVCSLQCDHDVQWARHLFHGDRVSKPSSAASRQPCAQDVSISFCSNCVCATGFAAPSCASCLPSYYGAACTCELAQRPLCIAPNRAG